MRYLILGLAALAIVWILHSVAQWAEDRGWIYYRKKRGSSGTLSAAALEVQSLFEPSQRYVLEEKKRDLEPTDANREDAQKQLGLERVEE